MHIDHDVVEFVPEDHLVALFGRFVAAAADQLAVSSDAVGRVVICSESRYGPTIDAIKAGELHSKNEVAVGVGKTIPREENGRVVCDIVLRADIFGAFGTVSEAEHDPASWSSDAQQMFYVLCHEFGHVQDHVLRADLFDPPDPRGEAFSVRATADYYGHIVLTEFAACRNAAKMMSRTLFDLELESVGERLQAVLAQTNGVLAGEGDLTRRALAHCVCQSAWVFLVELAKLYGHGQGNSALAAHVRTLESEVVNETPLTDMLDRYGAAYPRWDIAVQVEELTDVWLRYARELFGVKFVRRDPQPDEFFDVL